MIDKNKSFIEKALTKQFEVIGELYEPKKVKPHIGTFYFLTSWIRFLPNFISKYSLPWYLRHSWTSEQKERFHKWFITAYRKEFKTTKRNAEREWSYWDLDYGFREE